MSRKADKAWLVPEHPLPDVCPCCKADAWGAKWTHGPTGRRGPESSEVCPVTQAHRPSIEATGPASSWAGRHTFRSYHPGVCTCHLSRRQPDMPCCHVDGQAPPLE